MVGNVMQGDGYFTLESQAVVFEMPLYGACKEACAAVSPGDTDNILMSDPYVVWNV